MNLLDQNTIFYGPPGTGKTYTAKKAAEQLIQQQLRHTGDSKQYLKDHIQVCTFHQSLSYEEFIEGIRIDENNQFKTEDGMFKQISQHAKESWDAFKQRRFIQMSLGTSDDTYFKYGLEHNMVSTNICTIDSGKMDETTYKENHEAYDSAEKLAAISIDHWKDAAAYLHIFKNELKTGDIIFISDHENKDTIHAIAKVVGDYEYESKRSNQHYKHIRKVEWLWKEDIKVKNIYKFDQFKYDIKQLSELNRKDFELSHDLLQLIDPLENYVLIIDEINRGNIAQIFGELITLIEPDKRIGASEETSVTLPYSKSTFSIPQNLYIVATMNTADRSIALMDTALRRRFTFKEIMPQPKNLKTIEDDNYGQISLKQLLATINERIEFLYDREHTIGHAYFMHCADAKDILNVFTKSIIPLLQEHFFNDWHQLELILGGAAENETDTDYFLVKKKVSPDMIFNDLTQGELQTKTMYSIITNPTPKALLNILKR